MTFHIETADLDQCRIRGHHFQMIGSDKTPMKRSLICIPCTLERHKNVYVAFGQEYGAFGAWPDRRRKEVDSEVSAHPES